MALRPATPNTREVKVRTLFFRYRNPRLIIISIWRKSDAMAVSHGTTDIQRQTRKTAKNVAALTAPEFRNYASTVQIAAQPEN